MKKLPLCLVIALATFVSRADSSVTLSNRYTLVAGQAVLPSNSQNFTVTWPDYSSYDYLLISKIWMSPFGWSGSTPTFAPGHGFIASGSFTNIMLPLRDPTSVVSPLALPAGFSIVCCQSNVPATFEMIVGRSPDGGTKIYRLLNYNSASNDIPLPSLASDGAFTVYSFVNSSWRPEPPIVNIGEAVWIFQPPVISNLQITNGTVAFSALTGWATSTDVLWTDSLTGSWQVLTNFANASGSISNVVDSIDPNAPTQRFYRLRMTETSH